MGFWLGYGGQKESKAEGALRAKPRRCEVAQCAPWNIDSQRGMLKAMLQMGASCELKLLGWGGTWSSKAISRTSDIIPLGTRNPQKNFTKARKNAQYIESHLSISMEKTLWLSKPSHEVDGHYRIVRKGPSGIQIDMQPPSLQTWPVGRRTLSPPFSKGQSPPM